MSGSRSYRKRRAPEGFGAQALTGGKKRDLASAGAVIPTVRNLSATNAQGDSVDEAIGGRVRKKRGLAPFQVSVIYNEYKHYPADLLISNVEKHGRSNLH